ncbi:MAG: zf-TFIIB domain-containing protein [Vulcanimicrobiota bacterium]
MGVLSEFFNLFFGNRKGPAASKNPPVCPGCGLALERVQGGKGCHRCSRCQGLWVTEDFLALALQAQESQIGGILGGQTGAHTFARSAQQRECPGCERLMENYPFGYQSGIWVDGCPDGHGLWLDAGELRLIRDFQERQRGPMTPEERARMAMAFLDGASTSRRNVLDAMPQPELTVGYESNDSYPGDPY